MRGEQGANFEPILGEGGAGESRVTNYDDTVRRDCPGGGGGGEQEQILNQYNGGKSTTVRWLCQERIGRKGEEDIRGNEEGNGEGEERTGGGGGGDEESARPPLWVWLSCPPRWQQQRWRHSGSKWPLSPEWPMTPRARGEGRCWGGERMPSE